MTKKQLPNTCLFPPSSPHTCPHSTGIGSDGLQVGNLLKERASNTLKSFSTGLCQLLCLEAKTDDFVQLLLWGLLSPFLCKCWHMKNAGVAESQHRARCPCVYSQLSDVLHTKKGSGGFIRWISCCFIIDYQGVDLTRQETNPQFSLKKKSWPGSLWPSCHVSLLTGAFTSFSSVFHCTLSWISFLAVVYQVFLRCEETIEVVLAFAHQCNFRIINISF